MNLNFRIFFAAHKILEEKAEKRLRGVKLPYFSCEIFEDFCYGL